MCRASGLAVGKTLRGKVRCVNVRSMKAAVETELMEISRKLSPKKRREWLNYGHTLYTQTEKKPAAVEEDGDAAWERIIADPTPRPKLRAYVERILREERAEPMDIKKL